MDDLIKIEYEIMPFGEHAGKYFDQLPENYVIWLIQSLQYDTGPMAAKIKKYLGPLYRQLVIEQDKRIMDELESRKSTSEYIGKIGESIILDVKIDNVFWIKRTGVYMILMSDINGDVLTAFHDGSVKFKKREEIKISGIVKGHREYAGEKQTTLSKLKRL